MTGFWPVLWVLLACTGSTPHADPADLLVHREAVLTGTLWSFTVRTNPGREAEAAGAIAEAVAEVARLEGLLSERRSGSDVFRVNAGAGGPPVRVDPEVSALLARALDLCLRSGRRMDPTFVPLGRLWDLDRLPFVVPGEAAIAEALALVDCSAVEVDPLASTVRLPRPGMALGVGAFAKGYAVDRSMALLQAAGFSDALVDGGGDMLARGTRQDGPWRVGIRHPRGPAGTLVAVVPVTDRAVVTSGDAERYVEVDGRRIGHVLDPATGRPAGSLASVTVLAPDAETADGLATALFVAGEAAAGAILATHPAVDALFVRPDGSLQVTPGARSLLQPGPQPASVSSP
ncbi:MAG: FAD:protein FMN transferase [Deltaproteobacteria bacterium]|nr:FAD:protein FMN transferase [Deltaproteobacteria bacterium]